MACEVPDPAEGVGREPAKVSNVSCIQNTLEVPIYVHTQYAI